MLKYIGKRLLLFIPTIIIISVVIFFIIQLPPGDYVTSYVAAMAAEGEIFTPAEIEAVSRAISLHSDKAGQHDALTEVLIDADVLQHSLRDPLCDPKPHEAARFEALLAELGVQKRL